MALDSDWRLVSASGIDAHRWSFGRVQTVAELYSQKTFGAEQRLRCECGKYTGEEKAGRICDACGVKVSADADLDRRRRMGHIDLAVWCPHPLDQDELIDAFPVAPVAFRIGTDGMPNALGRKYEHLVELNQAVMEALPTRESDAYYPAAVRFDRTPVMGAIAGIIGVAHSAGGAGTRFPAAADSLLQLLFKAFTRAPSDVPALVRSCGYALHVTARV